MPTSPEFGPAAPRPPAPEPRERTAPAPSPVTGSGLRPEHLYKAAGLLFLLALLYRFFDEVSRVFLLAYAAAIVAVVLNAIVQPVPVQRRWVAGLLGLAITSALVATIWLGAPALMGQLRGLSDQIPQLQQQVQQWGEWIRRETGLNVDLLGERSRSILRGSVEEVQGGDVLGRARGLLEGLFLPLLVLFGGLFAVAKPNDHLLNPVLRMVSRERRPAFHRMFDLLGERLRGWVKGTLLSMLAVGLLSGLSFFLLGVEYALLLGVVIGIAEFIPLVGPWIGGLVAVLVTFLDDPQKALWVALAVFAIQQIEGSLITPLVMASVAEVHPFVTLFALVLFGSLFGFLGILLALPIVLLVWTVVEVLWVERAIDTDEDRIEPVVEE